MNKMQKITRKLDWYVIDYELSEQGNAIVLKDFEINNTKHLVRITKIKKKYVVDIYGRNQRCLSFAQQNKVIDFLQLWRAR